MPYIGFNTGRDKSIDPIERNYQLSSEAIEVSCHIPSAKELAQCARFRRKIIHVPLRWKRQSEADFCRALENVPDDWALVVHPKTIEQPRLWDRFVPRLRMENMQCKPFHDSTALRAQWETLFPGITPSFCFDIAHAFMFDFSGNLAANLYAGMMPFIAEIHICCPVRTPGWHHGRMTEDICPLFRSVLHQPAMKGVTVILETPAGSPEEMRMDLELVRSVFSPH